MMTRKINYRSYILACLMICLVAISPHLMAQRISFGVFAGEGITIDSPMGINPGLDFNQKQRIITSRSGSVSIGRAEGEPYVVYRIQAAEGFDLMIDVNQTNFLWLEGDADTDNSIPLIIRIAYNNEGAPNAVVANMSAIDAPTGMNSLIIPVSKNTSLAPGPPPDPLSGETPSRNKATMFLFIYGDLGPIRDVQPGLYSAEININVSYASYL